MYDELDPQWRDNTPASVAVDPREDARLKDPFWNLNPFQRAAAIAREAAKNAEPEPEKKEPTWEQERKAHETKLAADKLRWQSHGRSTHVPLDEKTLAARAAWHAEKTAAKNPAPAEPQGYPIDQKTLESVVSNWIAVNSANGNWYNSDFNFKGLSTCLSDHIARGEHFSYGLLDVIAAELKEGNHLERQPGPRIRGSWITRSSPTPYVRQELTITEKEQLAQQKQSAEEAEIAEAKAMPLDELKRRMRAQFRDTRGLDVRGGR